MKIAVFGTGNVGATLGTKFLELGREVMMGSRTAREQYLPTWARRYGTLKTGTFNIKIVR